MSDGAEGSSATAGSATQRGQRGVARWAQGLEVLLADPIGSAAFSHFLSLEYAEENINFWYLCECYASMEDPRERSAAAKHIWAKHLSENATEPVNIDADVRRATNERMSQDSPPKDLFMPAQRHIYNLMKLDSYPRFVRSKIHAESARAADLRGQTPPHGPSTSAAVAGPSNAALTSPSKRSLHRFRAEDVEEDEYEDAVYGPVTFRRRGASPSLLDDIEEAGANIIQRSLHRFRAEDVEEDEYEDAVYGPVTFRRRGASPTLLDDIEEAGADQLSSRYDRYWSYEDLSENKTHTCLSAVYNSFIKFIRLSCTSPAISSSPELTTRACIRQEARQRQRNDDFGFERATVDHSLARQINKQTELRKKKALKEKALKEKALKKEQQKNKSKKQSGEVVVKIHEFDIGYVSSDSD